MSFISVMIAAAGSWIFGAMWYMALAKPWVAASKIEVDDNGRPVDSSPLPFVMSAIAMIIVAGMMRHMFSMAGITEVTKGITAGLGVGLFFISPWIMINNAYGMRPFKLTIIDSGYATFGCGIMGLLLTVL
ncbi:MAG: DUF1761 domain-containing protein [Paracoccaceae bacterium]|nr:DUF1761 domain-containing protein [Paracoccaceae bacterium]MDG2259802.1 DUF1761 domain-containing protein [Paracoccaceae bacterium]